MINLKHKRASGASSQVAAIFESGTVLHPLTTGTNSVTYTLNHNFGSEPDAILVFQYVSGEWLRVSDYTIDAHYRGFGHGLGSSDVTNQTKVDVYHLTASGARNIKFRLIRY